MNQTYDNFELLLIDDGLTDGSGQLCDKFAIRSDKVRVIHQANAGVSVARNTGLERANGDYVTFIDSDDWIEHDYLKRMMNLMTSEGFVAGYLVSNDNSPKITEVTNTVTIAPMRRHKCQCFHVRELADMYAENYLTGSLNIMELGGITTGQTTRVQH